MNAGTFDPPKIDRHVMTVTAAAAASRQLFA
jgi:hypothetical protein